MKPQPESAESFDVDGMLGKLAKWLRILGFDAEYPRPIPSQGRIFLTARRRVKYSGAIVVSSSNCLEQLKHVLDEAGVTPAAELFLSRCLECNVPVTGVSLENVKDRVPPAILATPRVYNLCPVCSRVYWDGSHYERMKKRLRESEISVNKKVCS